MRLASGLFVDLRREGARVWIPERRTLVPVDADALAVLVRFGDGLAIADAAEAAGVEDDDVFRELIASFVELGLLVDDAGERSLPRPLGDGIAVREAREGVVTAEAAVDGEAIEIVVLDPARQSPGGSPALDEVLAAIARPQPVIYVLDDLQLGGAPERELVGEHGIGTVYAAMARRAAPQVAVVTRTLSRPMSFLPALADLVIMSEGARVHLGDPAAVREFLGQEADGEELGGVALHATRTGLCDVRVASEGEAMRVARDAIGWLTRSPREPREPDGELVAVPDDLATPFSMRAFLRGVVDGGGALELQRERAPELVTMFARLGGRVIGVVANDSAQRGGILGVDAAGKAARFVRLCDAHRIPFVAFADTPGFQIGLAAERAGIVGAGAQLFATLARASVPHVTVVVRKAHTAGLYAMGGPGFSPKALLALPGASIAIVGERALIGGVRELERQLDGDDDRARLAGYLRAARPDPASLGADVVEPGRLRAALIAICQSC